MLSCAMSSLNDTVVERPELDDDLMRFRDDLIARSRRPHGRGRLENEHFSVLSGRHSHMTRSGIGLIVDLT